MDNLGETIGVFLIGLAVAVGTLIGIGLAIAGIVSLFTSGADPGCLTMEKEFKKALINNDKQLARSILSENESCYTSSEVIKYIEILNKKD